MKRIAALLSLFLIFGCLLSCSDPAAGQGERYRIHYMANGADSADSGSPPQDSHLYRAGEMVTLPGNPGDLIKGDALFDGWGIMEGETLTKIEGEQVEMALGGIHLYALWIDIPGSTISYRAGDAESGVPPEDDRQYGEGEVVLAAANTGGLAKAGYRFQGWTPDPESFGPVYEPGDGIPMGTESLELFPVWVKVVAITYDSNGADVNVVPIDPLTYGPEETALAMEQPEQMVRERYVFMGWTPDPIDREPRYEGGDTIEFYSDEDMVLFAIWELIPQDGSEESPYLIYNIQELQSIETGFTSEGITLSQTASLDAHYRLMNDIDAQETRLWNGGNGFTPIGRFGDHYFSGDLDGAGYGITGLYINRGEDYQGLFGYLNFGGSVRNVSLIDGDITGGEFTGALAGYALDSEFIDCSLTGAVRGGANTGGLIGYAGQCRLSECESGGSVQGTYNAGGLIGQLSDGSILTDCLSTAAVGGSSSLGGLIGYVNDLCHVSDSLARGEVTAELSGHTLGGLIGQAVGETTLTGCSAEGDVRGGSNLGGLIGFVNSADIDLCYALGDVTGSLEESLCLGGLIGSAVSTYSLGITVDSSFARGSVIGRDRIGGLIGDSGPADITYCYASGDVTGMGGDISMGGGLGGLVGFSASGRISHCLSSGTVTGELSYIGGLVGDSGSHIANCYSLSPVSGDNYLGGLLGYHHSGQIENSYSLGRVSGGPSSVGMGGLAGGAYTGSAASDSYWDISYGGVSQDEDDAGGSGLGLGQSPLTLQNTDGAGGIYANWDTAVWDFGGGGDYPALRTIPLSVEGQRAWHPGFDIGDTGPAGGLVFYDKGDYQDGWRYLEAAPSDWMYPLLDPQYSWYPNTNELSGANGSEAGTGYGNTELLVNNYGEDAAAAKACWDYVKGEYDDWFLPSYDELLLIHDNLTPLELGGFESGRYWSSTEYNAIRAVFLNILEGEDIWLQNEVKSTLLYVRPVRAF